MAASCCGVKRQKVSPPTTCCNGSVVHPNQCNGTNGINKCYVVSIEMCFYCFEVLQRHLHSSGEPPPVPKFTNEPYDLKLRLYFIIFREN
ncbi:AMMECR1-like protein [Saccoglossus kowalevskii]